MLETALVAFTTFFATIGPLDVAALFVANTIAMAISSRRTPPDACVILLFFALFGKSVLASFGITLSALQASGGVLLLLIAIDMVFARNSGSSTTTDEERAEAKGKKDVSVFPLATPLIAGPGAIGAAVLLVAEAGDDAVHAAIVIAVMLGTVLLTFVLMLLATQVQKLLGVTGLHVISRIVGVLLAALAVQFIFNGIRDSGLLG